MGQFSQGRAGILENELKFSRSRISREAAKNAKQFSFNFAASREEDREVLKLLDQLEPEFDAVAEQQSRRLMEAHERFWCADGPPALPGSHPVLPVDLLGIYILLPE